MLKRVGLKVHMLPSDGVKGDRVCGNVFFFIPGSAGFCFLLLLSLADVSVISLPGLQRGPALVFICVLNEA